MRVDEWGLIGEGIEVESLREAIIELGRGRTGDATAMLASTSARMMTLTGRGRARRDVVRDGIARAWVVLL